MSQHPNRILALCATALLAISVMGGALASGGDDGAAKAKEAKANPGKADYMRLTAGDEETIERLADDWVATKPSACDPAADEDSNLDDCRLESENGESIDVTWEKPLSYPGGTVSILGVIPSRNQNTSDPTDEIVLTFTTEKDEWKLTRAEW